MWKKYIYNNLETDYSVSDIGEVRKDSTSYILSQSPQQDYKFVTLLINGQQKRMRVHRMVAETYIPTNNYQLEVHHKDGDKLNNSANIYFSHHFRKFTFLQTTN